MGAPLDLAQFADYLREYNKLTEKCFKACINTMNTRQLAIDEVNCVSSCAGKFLNINHKIMRSFQEIQPALLEKRNREAEEMLKKTLEAQKEAQEKLEINSQSADLTENPN